MRAPLVVAVALACACASPFRGPGPALETDAVPRDFTRRVEAHVHYGFPGVWQWELAYRAPDRYRLSIQTTGAPHHYVFDGSALTAWVGDAQLSRDVRDGDAYASIGRWLGLVSLAALPERPARFEDGARASLGRDIAEALSFRFADGSEYLLGFDGSGRVVAARGPIEIPGIGAGRLQARFRDFRQVAGRPVPFAASYRLNGEPFFDERVTAYTPGEAVLDPTGPARRPAGGLD